MLFQDGQINFSTYQRIETEKKQFIKENSIKCDDSK